jgi:hypothetical protein
MAHRLFKHVPTGQWVPLRMPDKTATPGAAYVPELAARYGLRVEDIEVLDGITELPADFEHNQVPRPPKPTPPPTALDQLTAAVMALTARLDKLEADASRAGGR